MGSVKNKLVNLLAHMAAGYCYCLGIKSNNFFLKDNKKAFILWLNVPKVTAYKQSENHDNIC